MAIFPTGERRLKWLQKYLRVRPLAKIGLSIVAAFCVLSWFSSQLFRDRVRDAWGLSVGDSLPTSLSLWEWLVVVGIVTIPILWLVPKRQIKRFASSEDKERFTVENEARKTLATILGGAFFLTTLYSSSRTLDLTREGQLTDRFYKAVEQLGALDPQGRPNEVLRLGGVYALGRIGKDSQRDYDAVMDILVEYVQAHYSLREKGCRVAEVRTQGTADLKTILKIIGTRNIEFERGEIDLSCTDLSGADLSSGDFRRVRFSYASLRGAHCGSAKFQRAILNNADLRDADFHDADMTGASLMFAEARGALFLNTTGAHILGLLK